MMSERPDSANGNRRVRNYKKGYVRLISLWRETIAFMVKIGGGLNVVSNIAGSVDLFYDAGGACE